MASRALGEPLLVDLAPTLLEPESARCAAARTVALPLPARRVANRTRQYHVRRTGGAGEYVDGVRESPHARNLSQADPMNSLCPS